MFGNRRHFRELQARSEQGIASSILAERLKKLTRAGLLTRDDAGPGQRATYSLTEPATALVPVLAHLGAWGLRHRPTTPALRVLAQLLEGGGPKLWAEFMDELREHHLGQSGAPIEHPTPSERLAKAYAEATAPSDRTAS